MINIPLNDIKKDHLFGEWYVENRFSISKDTTNIFSKNNRLVFNEAYYNAINGVDIRGVWDISMKTSTIYNPLLTFYFEEEEIAKAIITRLLISEKANSNNNADCLLTLYFANGLEVILAKEFKS